MSQSSSIRVFLRGITPSLFKNLGDQALQLGLAIERWTSVAGRATWGGVTVRWRFTESRQQLEIECVRCPFWSNRRVVERNIRLFTEMLLNRSRVGAEPRRLALQG